VHEAAGAPVLVIFPLHVEGALKAMIKPTLSILVVTLVISSLACSGDSGTSPTILPGAPFSTTDVRVGSGAEAVAGRRATVNYTGWIYDPAQPDNKGRQFDTSLAAGRTPFTLTLGAGQAIPGFDRGVTGMRVGGARRVVIPPDLAYGSRGQGDIPPNATLVFDIELMDVT
jgi:FKBP-type peptidyl-prolyl cis-trans isomerase FkpA